MKLLHLRNASGSVVVCAGAVSAVYAVLGITVVSCHGDKIKVNESVEEIAGMLAALE